MASPNPFGGSPFDLTQFDPSKLDPSKMDPQALLRISQLVQQLPPGQLSKMQTLMHNMMAGYDVKKEMEEFEKTLPAGFREQLTLAMMSAQSAASTNSASPSSSTLAHETEPRTGNDASTVEMNVREARLTLLRAVADGTLQPEEAERLLFKNTD